MLTQGTGGKLSVHRTSQSNALLKSLKFIYRAHSIPYPAA